MDQFAMSSGTHGTPDSAVPHAALEGAVAGLDRDPGAVLPALKAIQHDVGYLPEAALEYVSTEFDAPLASVVGTASFYDEFSFEPPARHRIRVCRGSACHVNESTRLLDSLAESLGADVGERSPDGTVSLEAVRCFGVCSQAPVVAVDDTVRRRMDAETVLEELEGRE